MVKYGLNSQETLSMVKIQMMFGMQYDRMVTTKIRIVSSFL